MKDVFHNLILPCQCYEPNTIMICVCPGNEKALRAYSKQDAMGKEFDIPPAMTLKQRAWCYNEIEQVEGYDLREHYHEKDSELARTVLNAWTDYCRDKGML